MKGVGNSVGAEKGWNPTLGGLDSSLDGGNEGFSVGKIVMIAIGFSEFCLIG